MTTLTLELQSELYAWLVQEVKHRGEPVEILVRHGGSGSSRRQRRQTSVSARSRRFVCPVWSLNGDRSWKRQAAQAALLPE